MFSKTNLISTLVTGLWAFFGGYLLWGILADPYLAEHVTSSDIMKETPDFLFLIIGCLIMAFAFSTIYSKWARGHHSISEGLKYGLWFGVLAGFGSGFIDYATANIVDMSGTLVNGLVYVVFYVIMGILASLIYGKLSSASE